MWKRLRIICAFIPFVVLSLLVLSCFLSSASAATTLDNSQPAVTLTYNEYRQLNDNLQTLAQNSTKQQQRIKQLDELLTIAQLSTNESQKALIEAKAQTLEQQTQLNRLNQSLEAQAQQLTKTQNSLQTANESLKTLESDLKKERAVEKRNKALAIVAAVAAVYFAAK